MSTYFFQWFCIQCIGFSAVNAQTETMFYFNGFDNPSDWQQVSGPASNKGAVWQPSTFGGCIHLKSGAATPCLALYGDLVNPPVVARVIPTVGYHSIRLQIDMRVVDLDNDAEICYIEYRSSIDWTRHILAQGGNNDYNTYNEEITIPHHHKYDNQPTFEIRIGIDANGIGDGCYFDNLEVFGIPISSTPNPTAKPADPDAATCEDTVSGTYNNAPVTFIINLPHDGDLQFDASSSNFPITDIEAFTKLNVPLATDTDGDEMVWLYDKPAGNYKFMIDSGTHTSGTFTIRIQCVYANPTPSPTTYAPTKTDTKYITTRPTASMLEILSCDESTAGPYEGSSTSMRVIAPFEVEVIFDASLSNFPIQIIQAFDTYGALIAFDLDHDSIVSFTAPVSPIGEYIFTFTGGEHVTAGLYHVEVTCTDDISTNTPQVTKAQNVNDNNRDFDFRSLDFKNPVVIIALCAIVLLSCVCCGIIWCLRNVCKHKGTDKAHMDEMRIHQSMDLTMIPGSPRVGLQMSITATGVVPMDDDTDRTRAYDTDVVATWLQETVDLPQYVPNFLLNGFESLRAIAQIENEKDLKQIGIRNKQHQTLIIWEIAKLKAGDMVLDSDHPEGQPSVMQTTKQTITNTGHYANYKNGAVMLQLEELSSSSSEGDNDNHLKTTSGGNGDTKCADCLQVKDGKICDDDGQFYCNECWKNVAYTDGFVE